MGLLSNHHIAHHAQQLHNGIQLLFRHKPPGNNHVHALTHQHRGVRHDTHHRGACRYGVLQLLEGNAGSHGNHGRVTLVIVNKIRKVRQHRHCVLGFHAQEDHIRTVRGLLVIHKIDDAVRLNEFLAALRASISHVNIFRRHTTGDEPGDERLADLAAADDSDLRHLEPHDRQWSEGHRETRSTSQHHTQAVTLGAQGMHDTDNGAGGGHSQQGSDDLGHVRP